MNKQRHKPTGLCGTHRRMQLRGEDLRPLRKRNAQQSATCTGPECSRPSVAHDLCKAHGKQLRETGKLHVIGDREYRAHKSREAWGRRSPGDRQAHIAKMIAGRPGARTEEHSRNLSAALRESWERKLLAAGPYERPCLTCGETFAVAPKVGGRQYYCSIECRRMYQRLRRYGLTYQEYRALIERQGGVCALCGQEWRGWGGKSGLHVDHCHQTGQVRGLLCGDCNTALGRFGDDPAILRRAADYLEGH